MLLGLTIEKINDTGGFFDQYPFIWKDFMKAGYMTFIGEDDSSISTFKYLAHGFKWAPVDYYLRPFMLGLETTNGGYKLCSGNVLVLQTIFDKLSDFITTYHDVPKFTFSFISKPSHDDHNGLGIVDLPLVRTLKDLNSRGLLDNTVLIVFGDHGNRYGPVRNTYQGRLEENLPAFYVSVPRWFRKEQSDLYENLKLNRNKLTSNVDIYATLQDIIQLGQGIMSPRITGKYGTSLLRTISTNRTCDDLKIPNQFCVCQAFFHAYSTESKIVRDISQWIVKEINTILTNVSHVCSDLTLNEISHAWRSDNSSNITGNSTSDGDYVIQFSVLPSHAKFEVTIRCYRQKFTLIGDILRTNEFRGESYCVASHKNVVVLERYCYCRKQSFISAKLAHSATNKTVRIAY
ncbi:uncharacterized protein LOC117316988 [Pecten maximus]|uniref:uncharacterized protein LOC117316988 n=1 Tax=Pecten maximus TaxID=6579 RepID=UPI00145830AC|nr:uncharacterized protein LOC117316988 [Pecten maximus]